MSRLYEALSRIGKDAETGTGITWKGLRTDASSRQDAPVLEIPSVDVEEVEEVEVPAPPAESDARSISAVVDGRLPLLPYALDPIIVEAYRRLRTKILERQQELGFRSLMIGSGNPQEGKTLTVLNLALSFGMLPSFRVLVIDGDIRKGTIADWLGIDHTLPGLCNVVDGSAPLSDVVLQADELPMHVILPGLSPVSPAELLNSPRLKENLSILSEQYDLILIDSPPVHLVTDAHLLAAASDAVLLVARGYSTNRKMFEKTAQEIGLSRVMGSVLNGGDSLVSKYGYYRREAK